MHLKALDNNRNSKKKKKDNQLNKCGPRTESDFFFLLEPKTVHSTQYFFLTIPTVYAPFFIYMIYYFLEQAFLPCFLCC